MTGYDKRKQRKRDQILSAAEELFKKQGFKKTTIDDVANRAGVSKVTVYNHFTDKRGLIEASVREMMQSKIEGYREILVSDRPWQERLNEIVLDKFRTVRDYSGEILGTLYYEMPDLMDEIKNLKLKLENEVTYSFLDEGRKLGFVPMDISNEAVAIFLACIARGLESNDDVLMRLSAQPKLAEELISIITYGMIQRP
ncbi:MAG: TetR/AcrR family transcriptional regulator [Spirochaetales bacterium]|nr:TetR/AcrR family transcriptional regulator [Spirochaetales bacterium]